MSDGTQTLLAVDGDGHIIENVPRIIELMEEPYRTYRKCDAKNNFYASLVPVDGTDRHYEERFAKRGTARNAGDWFEALDRGPMEWTALFPTIGLFAGYIRDPEYQRAFCRAYNSWLAEVCAQGKGRLLGVGMIPTHEPDADEVRRCKQLGMVGIMFPADGTHLLGHRRFDPVYQAAVELNLAVSVHASGSAMAPGAEVFPKFIQAHSVAHPYGILRQFTSMMFEGVFEKFPTGRFAFLEAGVTWVPWWLDRLDEEYFDRGKKDAPLLTKSPSQYVHAGGNIFFSCEQEERLLGQTMSLLGDDIVMYASDYPHWDGEYPDSLHKLHSRTDLTKKQQAGVLRHAAERFYGFTK
jgi:predicted TIM-barrel fold metal-dependent hydrolase